MVNSLAHRFGYEISRRLTAQKQLDGQPFVFGEGYQTITTPIPIGELLLPLGELISAIGLSGRSTSPTSARSPGRQTLKSGAFRDVSLTDRQCFCKQDLITDPRTFEIAAHLRVGEDRHGTNSASLRRAIPHLF